jgi:hypothetical protein
MVDRSVFVELFRHDLFLSSLLAPLFVERRSSFAVSAGDPIFDLDPAPLTLASIALS